MRLGLLTDGRAAPAGENTEPLRQTRLKFKQNGKKNHDRSRFYINNTETFSKYY